MLSDFGSQNFYRAPVITCSNLQHNEHSTTWTQLDLKQGQRSDRQSLTPAPIEFCLFYTNLEHNICSLHGQCKLRLCLKKKKNPHQIPASVY